MGTYHELNNRHQQEVNEFFDKNGFFAFSNQQFIKGLEKFHLNTTSYAGMLISIDGGGFVLKSKREEMHAMFDRHRQEMRQFQTDEKNLISSIVYELGNHEFCITEDVKEALQTLGIFREYETDERIQKAVSKAIELYNASVIC